MGIIESLDAGKSLLRRTLEEAPGLVDEASSLDVLPSMLRLPERDPRRASPEFFELAFGFIPTFNIGSAMGLHGVPQFLADVVLDPLNFLGMIGGATKTAKASKFLRAFAKGSGSAKIGMKNMARLVEAAAASDVSALEYTRKIVQTSKGYAPQKISELLSNARKVQLTDITGPVSAEEMGRKTVNIVGEIARPGRIERINRGVLPSYNTLRQVSAALRKGGEPEAVQFLTREIDRRMALRSKVSDLTDLADKADTKEIRSVFKSIRKLDKSVVSQRLFSPENLKRFELALDMELKGQKVSILPRASSVEARVANEAAAAVDGMAQPHRALVRVKVPFTNIEHVIAVGGPVLGAGARVAEKLGFAGPRALGLLHGAGRAERAADIAFKRPAPSAGYGTLTSIMTAAVDLVRNTPEKQLAESYADYHLPYVQNVTTGRTLGFLAEHNLNSYAAGVEESLGDYAKRTLGKTKGERTRGVLNLARGIVEEPTRYVTLPKGQRSLIYGTLTEEAKKMGVTNDVVMLADEMRRGFEQVGTEAVKHGIIEALIGDGEITGYFPRIVKVTKGRESEYRDWFNATAKGPAAVKKFYQHGELRSVPFYRNLLELEKKGIVQVVKDPALLMREYIEAFVQASSRAKIFKNLGIAKIPLEIPQGMGPPAKELIPMFLKDYGEEYKHLEKLNIYERVTDKDVLTFSNQFGIVPDKGGVLIEKTSATQMKRLLREYKPGPVMQAINKLNSFAKRSLLSLSAFHYMALTQSAAVDLGWEFFRHPIQAIKSGQRSFFDATDEMIYAVSKAGLTLGPMMDAEIEVVRRGLTNASKDVSFTSKASQELGKLTGIWDRGLWDYYHNAAKLHAFQSLHANAMARFAKAGDSLDVAKGVAQHVNMAFGGLEWERMMVSKPMQQFLRYLLLAPDWTISNLGIAQDIYANKFKKFEWYQRFGKWWGFQVGPEDVLKADVRAFYARRYAFHAAALYYPFMSMINHAFTGHHIWDNPEHYRTMVELPWKDDEGKKLFADVGKQFREPQEFLEDLTKFPEMKYIRRKHSQILGKSVAALTGRDLFTGVPIVAKQDGMLYDSAKKIWYFLSGALPIPVQDALGPMTKEIGVGPSRADKSAASIGLGMLGLPIRTEFTAPPQKPVHEAFDDVVKTDTYKRQIEKLARETAAAQSFLPSTALMPVAR